MKDPVQDQERNIKIIIATIGTIILIISIYFTCLDFYLEQKSIRVSGKITSINTIEGKTKANVLFRLTGHEYEALITINNSKYAVNDKITIKVDMYNPKKEIINNHYFIYIPGFFLSLIATILSLPYLIKYFKTQKHHNSLKKNGFFINATITDVFLNNNPKLKKHDSYPYRLRAKYFNPQNQTEYIFESDDTYVNINDPINEYQKTTVTVYLNQSNIKSYYVDLDSLYPPLELVDPIAIMGPKTEIKFRFGTKAEQEYQRELSEKNAQENPENPANNEPSKNTPDSN